MFWICGFFWTKYDLRPAELKVCQKNNKSCELQLSTKSKAKSIAFASAVKTDEPSGMHIVWWSFSLETAQPTLSLSFDPSYRYADNPRNATVAHENLVWVNLDLFLISLLNEEKIPLMGFLMHRDGISGSECSSIVFGSIFADVKSVEFFK